MIVWKCRVKILLRIMYNHSAVYSILNMKENIALNKSIDFSVSVRNYRNSLNSKRMHDEDLGNPGTIFANYHLQIPF
jgi:hypothetical protein